jgi:two-component system response regulator DesR
MIRLLLADDQELIRSALAALLAVYPDFKVVAAVGRGDEVVAAARAYRPDVALLDIEMPGIDGLAAAGVLSQEVPECRSLILTTFGRPGYLRRAMESGARATEPRPPGRRTSVAGSECTAKVVVCHGASWP